MNLFEPVKKHVSATEMNLMPQNPSERVGKFLLCALCASVANP